MLTRCALIDAYGTSPTLVPIKIGGLNIGATYTANFTQQPNITISYLAGANGSVSKTSESLAPATGTATGSIATAAPGYKFVNWTNSVGTVVSTAVAFIPQKVGGLNVVATYTANFTEKPNITITYKANGDGTVTPGSESLAPATGAAAGSTAKPTNSNGWTTYTFINWTNSIGTEVSTDLHYIPGKVNGLNVAETYTANFNSQTCPFVYSYDGEDYHFEHEPVPYSVMKSFETISYGTLRELLPVDGQYHVRISEELESETFVNGFSLFAIDYLADGYAKEVFVDIFGTPHTIRNRIAPKTFVDSAGKSWLDDVTTKGPLVSSDISMFEQGKYTESYEAIFDRPEDSNGKAKFMVSTKVTKMVDGFGKWFYDQIDGQNNVWWFEKAIESSPYFGKIIEAINMTSLEVDLWDGSKWVNQGQIQGGSHLLEEFLIPLDLSIINGETDEIKVRLTGGAGFFQIGQISIDFSQDEIANIQRLNLDSALYNGAEEVGQIIDDLNNEQRVKLQKGDNIDLYYNIPNVDEGLRRGFVVEFKGYFHSVINARENPIIDSWEGMSYQEIVDAVLVEQPEAADILPSLNQLYELADLVDGGSLDYKIEKIMVDYVLPWMFPEN